MTKCEDTRTLFETGKSASFGSILKVATRQYSIRVNDQWRICFRWTPAGPEDVEIVDYH